MLTLKDKFDIVDIKSLLLILFIAGVAQLVEQRICNP